MPYDGSGTFSRVYDWTDEQAASPIEISKLDEQEVDIALALSNCLLRDGTGIPTANTPWNNKRITGLADASAATDALNRQTGDARYALLSGATFTGAVVAPSVTVNGASVPANGVYLPGANTVGIASNTTLRLSVGSTGQWTFQAPSAGTTLNINAVDAANAFISRVLGGTNNPGLFVSHTEATRVTKLDASGSTSGVLALATSGTTRQTINESGNVTINAPSSGTALTIDNPNTNGLILKLSGTASGYIGVDGGGVGMYSGASYTGQGFYAGSSAAGIYTASALRLNVASAGNVTINAPSSGTTISASAVSGGSPLSMTDGTVTAVATFSGATFQIGATSNHEASFFTNNTTRVRIAAAGNVTINAPSSGVGLTISGGGLTVSGGGATITGTVTGTTFSGSGASLTNLDATQLTGTVNTARISGSYTGITAIGAATINDSGGSPFNAGYLGMPQSTNTSLVLTDRGKHILLSGTTNTVTIPANASVAFEVGSTIVLVNDGSGNTTLNITTDTLEWFQGGTSSTGSRTIATKSIVTLVKVASTRWALTGAGVS
jgi:hypothetical protein